MEVEEFELGGRTWKKEGDSFYILEDGKWTETSIPEFLPLTVPELKWALAYDKNLGKYLMFGRREDGTWLTVSGWWNTESEIVADFPEAFRDTILEPFDEEPENELTTEMLLDLVDYIVNEDEDFSWLRDKAEKLKEDILRVEKGSN